MTATGSHFDFDSLRGAPLARNDMVLFGHFAILRQLRVLGKNGVKTGGQWPPLQVLWKICNISRISVRQALLTFPEP